MSYFPNPGFDPLRDEIDRPRDPWANVSERSNPPRPEHAREDRPPIPFGRWFIVIIATATLMGVAAVVMAVIAVLLASTGVLS